MTTVNLQEMFQQYQREDEVTVLEEGEYTLEVIRCAVRGENAVMPVYKVIGGPYAGKTVMAGQLTLTENSRSIFFRNLKGFGLDEAFILQSQGLQDVANALVGRVVKMKITKRQWQGADRNQFPIGGVSLISLPSAPGAPQIAAQPAAPVAPAAPVPAAAPAAPVAPAAPAAPAAQVAPAAPVAPVAPAAPAAPPAAVAVADPAAAPPPPPPAPAGGAPSGSPF